MTANKEKALAALLVCPTRRAAAQAAGISPRTLRGYLADPEFQARCRAAFGGVVEDAAHQAQQAMGCALAVLRSIMEDEDQTAPARIQAAKTLLECALRLTELTDVLARLEALEGSP